MPKPEDCVLIHFVEEQAIGFQFPRRRNDWPLHITLASWFTAGNVELLTKELEAVAAAAEPFKLQVGELAMFGPKQNVPVNVITNQEPVAALHESLAAAVHENNGVFDSTRWFEPYCAHITQHDDAVSQEGDVVAVDNFHMVRLLPDDICEVSQQFDLGARS